MKPDNFSIISLIILLAFFCIGVCILGSRIKSQKKIIKAQEITIEEHKSVMITIEKNLKDGFADVVVAHDAAEYDKKTGELYFVNECENGCGECGEEYLLRDLIDNLPRPELKMGMINE